MNTRARAARQLANLLAATLDRGRREAKAKERPQVTSFRRLRQLERALKRAKRVQS